MDEREVHELLSGAVASVQPSPNLPERAERRYRTRRVRGRVLATAVVIALIGSGIATAQMVGTDDDQPAVVAPTSTIPLPVRSVTPNELVSLAFVDANIGYGVGGSELEPVLAKTEDGGRTWRAIGRMPVNATAISVVPGHSASRPSLLAWGSGLYVSSDDGSNWRRTRSDAIQQVAVASGRVWITTFCAMSAPCNEAVTFSDDSGRSWKVAALRQTAAGAATLVAVSRDVVYVAKVGRSGWLIAKTGDGGRHWTSEPAPCPAFTESASLAMNDRTLLLACDGQLAGTTTRKAVFLSSDGGRTWEGGGKLPGTGAIFVAFRSSFVANTGRTGIYTSTDDGRSWQVALASNGAPSTNVLRNAGVWVILHGENDGLWFSADGVHWERRTGATAVDSNSTTTTSTVPSGPIDLGFTRSLSFVDANVGFGVNHYYLVRTDDGGRTWHRVSELQNDLVHFANASDGVAYGGGGMHFTRDGGLHWSAVGDPVESVLGWSDGRLWGFRPCDAGCRSLTPEVSDDGGRTWRAVEGGVQGREVSAFVANSRFTAYTLVVGGTTVSPSLRLASTHDAGATWRYDAVPCSPYEHLFLAASDRSLLLVCGQEPFSGAQQTMRVYTSSDRGSSWTREKAQPSAGNIDGLKSFDSVYFAELGRGDGALSTDNGHSWQLPGFPIVFDEGGLGFSTLPGVGVWAWKVGAAGIWFSADGTHWEKRAGR